MLQRLLWTALLCLLAAPAFGQPQFRPAIATEEILRGSIRSGRDTTTAAVAVLGARQVSFQVWHETTHDSAANLRITGLLAFSSLDGKNWSQVAEVDSAGFAALRHQWSAARGAHAEDTDFRKEAGGFTFSAWPSNRFKSPDQRLHAMPHSYERYRITTRRVNAAVDTMIVEKLTIRAIVHY